VPSTVEGFLPDVDRYRGTYAPPTSAAGDHAGMADYEESAPCTLALSTTCSNRTSLSPEKVKT